MHPSLKSLEHVPPYFNLLVKLISVRVQHSILRQCFDKALKSCCPKPPFLCVYQIKNMYLLPRSPLIITHCVFFLFFLMMIEYLMYMKWVPSGIFSKSPLSKWSILKNPLTSAILELQDNQNELKLSTKVLPSYMWKEYYARKLVGHQYFLSKLGLLHKIPGLDHHMLAVVQPPQRPLLPLHVIK